MFIRILYAPDDLRCSESPFKSKYYIIICTQVTVTVTQYTEYSLHNSTNITMTNSKLNLYLTNVLSLFCPLVPETI